VQVRRLEDKLGIHGSPTCELQFDDAPAKLIGERQRGLITYVMALMNGARIGIAAQSLGIAEAAFRVARNYASKRKQFNMAIDQLPAVREMLVRMALDIKAARTLTYFASLCVDIEHGALRAQQRDDLDAAAVKQARTEARRYKRFNDLLTPMCKYYASEMCNRVANEAISVLGGSGYMKDYSVERHWRDARITNIYEGTSQMQIVAASRGVTSGTAGSIIDDLLDRPWNPPAAALVEMVRDSKAQLDECVEFVKGQSQDYIDLHGRRLVDMAITLLVGALFCEQAADSREREQLARLWLAERLPELHRDMMLVRSGDRTVITDFGSIVGDIPELV
jgi:alkylation response protein AidB-like acyl-CoA dehydrogenase